MPGKNGISANVELEAEFAPSDANVEALHSAKETHPFFVKEKRSLSESELLIGSQPDYELRAQPRWLFFSERDLYERHQYTRFSIRNREAAATVAFRFRVKEQKMLLFMPTHGFLAPEEEIQVTVVLTRSAMWHADPQLMIGRVHKFILENTVVHPALLIPNSVAERTTLARRVFGTTCCRTFGQRNNGIGGGAEVSTLERCIYTKMRAVLPFIVVDGASSNDGAFTRRILMTGAPPPDNIGGLAPQLPDGLSNA